jgi:hypothetical protein
MDLTIFDILFYGLVTTIGVMLVNWIGDYFFDMRNDK